jgi:hypothetical protein
MVSIFVSYYYILRTWMMKRLGKDIYALRLMKKDEKGCLMFITIVCLGFTVGKL